MNLRFDRLATLYMFNPVQRGALSGKSSIPILMYHSVVDDPETKMHAYYRTTTSPLIFKQHMQHLRHLGYSTIQISEAVKMLQNGGSTQKYVVITFDDGYADFYRYAFPELDRNGFTATVFLPTAYIGDTPVQFKGKDCLTWSEVRELRKHGISFGSHTVTHPQLCNMDECTVKDELVHSKQVIEDNLGETVDSFAYPFAFPETNKPFVQMLRRLLVDAGYAQGVSTCIGTAHPKEDPYFLRRLPINSLDDTNFFSAKLQGGYDWLHKIQYAAKRLRANS
jgi:peptidoglycan/xylan/chitin deacetylase (PgdA/CDA1 family)